MKRRIPPRLVGKESGVKLISPLLGLTLVLTLVVVGIFLYNRVFGPSRAEVASKGLIALAAGIKLMHPRPDFSGLGYDGMVGAGVVVVSGRAPIHMVRDGALVDAFNGAVAVMAVNYAGGTNNAYAILYPRVGRQDCVRLIERAEHAFRIVEVGSATETSSFVVRSNGTVKDLSVSPPLRPTPALVSVACNDASNAIRFIGT